MPKLAQRMRRTKPSAIMVIAARANELKAQGRDIISFSIGAPNFLPGPHVYAAAHAALDHDTGQYGSSQGDPVLLDAFIQDMERIGLTGYTRENCAVGTGAKQMLFNLATALMDEGDEIIFASPYWSTYMGIMQIAGAKVTAMPCPPEHGYKLTPDQLDAALANKPRVFLFDNPTNPSGMVYSKDEITALADVILKHPDTWVIIDDIYHHLVFDGLQYYNFLQVRPQLRDRAIFLDSLSKTYGMPGWRIGLIAGPPEVAQSMATLNSNHVTNLPEVVTAAAVAALTGPQDIPEKRRADFQHRRDLVMDALGAIDGLVCPRPQGAFYAFPDISCAFGKHHDGKLIADGFAFCTELLESKGVACVPGTVFGEPRGIRIAFTCPIQQLEPGLTRLQEFFAELT